MADRVSSFLGGSPLSVIVKLVLLSIAVGLVLSWLDWSPREILYGITDFFRWIWYSLFGSLDRALDYFILGAVIVVPLFIISRLLKIGRR
jgi:hypothetical protein